ncbi:MAG: CopG family transcriptional regulator [Acidobacteriota bacterium]|nr:MAG: CopG family transcriptional regulator [Acidobacteriota bacterium]
MTAKDFDEIFDKGEEDVLQYADLSTLRKVNESAQRVNVDFPRWVVNRLDRESKRLGVSRQSLVKFWITERLDSLDRDDVKKAA